MAGQCLASIAMATSLGSPRHLGSSSPSHADLAPSALPAAAPAPESWVGRLPSITAPPFVRTTTTAWPRVHAPEAPGIRDSVALAAFVRRSSPSVPPVAAFSSGSSGSSGRSLGSVAPVSMSASPSRSPEPTVILVRERPRSIWIVAAAAFGALGALAAMRLAPAAGEHSTGAATQAASQPAPALALPSTAVVGPSAVVLPVASAPAVSVVAPAAPAPEVMHFADDQGVAFKAPAPPPAPAPRKPSSGIPGPAGAPAARPAQTPRAPSLGPALPDGSFGLGRSETSTAPALSPSPALTVSAAPPEPMRKRALTPEQQLADAQLKASMK